MAKIKELSEEWEAWVKSRPSIIRKLCRSHPPDRLYLLTSTGYRVEIYGYLEDGTVIVSVLGKWNALVFERNVFGIKPEELIECDLPSEDEVLGVVVTDETQKREKI